MYDIIYNVQTKTLVINNVTKDTLDKVRGCSAQLVIITKAAVYRVDPVLLINLIRHQLIPIVTLTGGTIIVGG